MRYDLQKLRGDVFGGVTVAVVGLPTALAFGVASGLGAVAGLYGAVAVGFFAATFGGTRGQISGPTGPMAIAMAVIVTTHAETLAEAFTIVILAGLMQVLLGLLRIGRFAAYTPYEVIAGFMTGIGVIIILVQSLPFLGLPAASGGARGAVDALFDAPGNVNLDALAIAGATLAVGLLWPARLGRYVPSTLAALVVGVALGMFWLTGAPVIGEVPSGLPTLHAPDLSAGLFVRAVEPAIILALLGSIDTLLTALVADSLTRTRHSPDKELVGQGLGNLAAGLVGGLPGAGNTSGSVVNIRAGGRSPVAGVICSALLLGVALGLGQHLANIPTAALAGILTKVGLDIIEWRFIKRAPRMPRRYLIVMAATLALTVFVDLVTAVAIGLIAAGLLSAHAWERLELDHVVSTPLLDSTFLYAGKDRDGADPFAARVGLIAMRGMFTVASSGKMLNAFGPDLPDHEVVIIDFTRTEFIDDSAAVMIEELIVTAYDNGTEPVVLAASGPVWDTLTALGVLRRVPPARIVGTMDEARDAALRILGEE